MSCPLREPYTLIPIVAGLALTLLGSPYDVIGLAVVVATITLSILNSVRRGGVCKIQTAPKEAK